MGEVKTRATDGSVDAFIEALPIPQCRDDAKKVRALFERLTGEPAKMWGPTIIGFGSYRYRYESGHSGVMCRLGFSPRKAELVLYVLTGFAGQADLLARLGRHRTGKVCLYIKKLPDVDEAVLEEIAQRALAHMNEKYPDNG
jgi:hypothetical protein